MTELPETNRKRWDEASRWLVFVDEDLHAAEVLMAHRPPVVRGAAFHCQQAIEKMAKAVLVANGADVPKIHDVEELSWLVRTHDIEMGEAISAFGSLTSWATAARYPNVEENIMPSEHDVQAALSRLAQLRARIAALAPKA
jgi:HEPN domain-containing protein